MATNEAFNHSLHERLAAWIELFSKRGDIRVTQSKSALTELTEDEKALLARLPNDARAFAKKANHCSFRYILGTGKKSAAPTGLAADADGGFAFSLPGEDDDWGVVGEEVGDDTVEEALAFDQVDGCDGNGYFAFRDEGKPFVCFEEHVRFSSFSSYVTKGASRAFFYSWQRKAKMNKDSLAWLSVRSAPESSTEAQLRAALESQGASTLMAADLVKWLGADVRFLIAVRPA